MWFLLLLLWPIAEIVVAVVVANAIGVLLTVLLLVAGWPLGSWALRVEGRAVARRLAQAIAERRTPARETVDGVLVLLGGGLLLVPGFITDAIALLLLLPPTRALFRRSIVANLRSRLVVRAVQFTAGRQAYDVDSTASDINQPQLGA
jgi:UPF0716 protein FxsA